MSQVLEMAYPRRKIEQIVTGLERPLNRHLLKLVGLAAPEPTRAVWRKEVKRWLLEIASLRLKPSNRMLAAETLFEWLFEEPFGGAEARNAGALLALEADAFPQTLGGAEAAVRLRALHEALTLRLAVGDPGFDLIDPL